MCYTCGGLFPAVVCLLLAAVVAANVHQLHGHHSHGHHHSIRSSDNNKSDNNDNSNRQSEKPTVPDVTEDMMYNYLMQFDYLPKSNLETGALRTEEQLIGAIRKLQAFGNIPVTGKIDQATAKLLQTPRCGVGDNEYAYDFSSDNLDHSRRRHRRYVLQGAKWDKTDLTWSLVNQSMPDAGKVRQLMARALRLWESNSRLTFREVYSDQADVQVLFTRRNHGDGYKFDGPGNVLAHAFYPGVGRGGDVHFDQDETWEFEPTSKHNNTTNFLNVAVHELGHSLGLGHSSDVNAIMFPWYQNNEVNGTLPDDDRNGLQELYGAKEKVWAPYRPVMMTTTTTTTTTTTMRSLTYYPSRHNPSHYPSYYPNYYPNRGQEHEERERQERERLERERLERERLERERDRLERERKMREWQEIERKERERLRQQYAERELERRRERERERNRKAFATGTTTTTTTKGPTTVPTMGPTTARGAMAPRRPLPVQPTHRPYKYPSAPRHNKPYKPRKPKPDTCMTPYDAISMIRRELFIFRGQYLWRIGTKGLYHGYPTETRRHWAALPEDFNKVDAVYENQQRQIVFFIGRQYYVFDSVTLAPGYPQPLTSLGLPPSLTHVDAAFVWGYNNRTYLTSGTLYWRIDDNTGQVELDYPRDMSIWSGVGYNIDAAFQYTDGKTYFFKNLGYWEFNDARMVVAHTRPKLSSRKWMQCARSVNDVDEEQRWTAPLVSGVNETDAKSADISIGQRTHSLLILLTMYIHLARNILN